MASPSGAYTIAKSLHDLGVRVLFGIVGIPVVEIAEEAINLGIRFIGFRNEQAASYAASAYGYLTGKPGVCLVVGGPGVLHAMAGIGNSNANAFPLLVLAGSSETHLVSQGAFQELDAISLLSPHTKLSIRPPSLEAIPRIIQGAYRSSWYGRPGVGFVDLPADLIQGFLEDVEDVQTASIVSDAPKGGPDQTRLSKVVQLIKSAKAPLIVIGKGAAQARAENVLRKLIDRSRIPFLPTPMGKGVVADSHPLNTASARSTALKNADVVLVLGARLNWILHFGAAPKWNPAAKFIQVDISPEELGRNAGEGSLSLVGDISIVAGQLLDALGSWQYSPSSSFISTLSTAKSKNESSAAQKAADLKFPMSYANAFSTIKDTLHALSPPEDGRIVYVSEGANTMDISRSIFPVEHPRLRLDAGTYATMGVGLGYAIAAHTAYNSPSPEGSTGLESGNKKIVALEGDSAFGFSAMEIETMARYGMDILIFVMNNGGVYHGDSDSVDEWLALQKHTLSGSPSSSSLSRESKPEEVPTTDNHKKGLRSTSLGYEVRYELLASACGGEGFCVRSVDELRRATEVGFRSGKVCVVNVIVESGKGGKLEFGWQGGGDGGKKKKKRKKETRL